MLGILEATECRFVTTTSHTDSTTRGCTRATSSTIVISATSTRSPSTPSSATVTSTTLTTSTTRWTIRSTWQQRQHNFGIAWKVTVNALRRLQMRIRARVM
ncbi:unnamed protein product [Prorocentrum cordatum]|uniref:Uncharacterized protein n=1 Tax=Prorocentrum cordatum TaxID=2364126 RepID=A0ABN9YH00_9DINO|nr:unnamed protein product [Polarella glacialis]